MLKAVLTGDIINSKDISVNFKKTLYLKLSGYIAKLSESKGFMGELSRGDAFQCLIDKPELALRYALKLKFYLRSFPLLEKRSIVDISIDKIISTPIVDARIAIGLGQVDFLNERLGTSDGEAFQLSGKLLDSMKTQRNGLSADINRIHTREELQALLFLLDTLIQRTTAAQCQVMYFKLNGETETEIANKLKVKQSAVNQRSTAGGWRAIETALNHYEFTIKGFKNDA